MKHQRTRLHLLLACALLLALSSPIFAQDTEDEPGTVITVSGVDQLILGGQLRARLEYRDPFPPTTGSPSSTMQLLRARLHVDATFDEYLNAFVQFQESIGAQGSPSTSTVHQAFGQASGLWDVLDVQAGRFEMAYGNQRMVSPLDWSNFGRAWDGVRAVVHADEFQFDVFATQPVAGQGGTTGSQDFHGIYAQWEGDGTFSADVYGFKFRDFSVMLDDYTIGALVNGDYDSVSWSLEGAFQSGDFGTLDVGGYAFAAHVWVELGESAADASLGAGWEMASGDSNPADGNMDTFMPLFNFAHAYQGYADIVTWSNLNDFILSGKVPLNETWTGSLDVHFLSRAEAADAIYTGMGGAGAVAAGTSKNIGTEIDATLKGSLGSLGIWTGVSYFSAGSGIAGGDDQLWVFLQAVLDF